MLRERFPTIYEGSARPDVAGCRSINAAQVLAVSTWLQAKSFLSQPEEALRHYPEDIWAYLNSVPAGGHSQASRKEQLLAEWAAGGRTGPQDSPKSKEKIALLTATNAADKKLNFFVERARGDAF